MKEIQIERALRISGVLLILGIVVEIISLLWEKPLAFLLFVGVWLGLNALFGLGTISIGGEEGQQIAWQAHIGGFFAGLLLFNAFDPVVPPVPPVDPIEPDAASGA